MKRRYFFGWHNIKWVIREILKIYSSNNDSFFSKKRAESGVAFFVLQIGMVFFLYENHARLTASDFLIWAGIECAICGYMVNKIQEQKHEKISK